jgi:hypothetical protein
LLPERVLELLRYIPDQEGRLRLAPPLQHIGVSTQEVN